MADKKKRKRKSGLPEAKRGTEQWRVFLPALLILVLTFLVFGNSVQNGYTYDDKPFISENYLVKQGFKGIPKLLTTDFWTGYTNVHQVNPSYRPVPLITLAIEHQFWGLNPGINHFFNVLLYGLTCVLIFFLLKTFFRERYPYLALITALLFCVHPIHTEVVANIKGRDDLLALFGGLLSLYLLFRYAETQKLKFFVFSILSYSLALMSKEHIMTWVAIVPLTLYFFGALPIRRIMQYSIPFWVASLIYFALRVSVLGSQVVVRTDFIDNPILKASTTAEMWATKISVLWLFVQKLLVPYPLSSDYSYAALTPGGWSTPTVYLALAAYGLLGFFALRGLKQKSIWSYGIFFFLIEIIPISNLFFEYVVAFAERAMYTPSFGFISLLSAALYLLGTRVLPNFLHTGPGHYSPVVKGALILLLAAGGLISFLRNPAWRSDFILFSTDVRTHPESVRLNLNYAQQLIDRNSKANTLPVRNDMDEARSSIDRAMALIPDLARGHLLYGNLYKVQEQYAQAEAEYLRALELDSTNAAIFFNLGLMAQVREDLARAESFYVQSLEFFPNYPAALVNLGIVYGSQNKLDQCIETLEKSFRLEPDPTTAANLERAYSLSGNHAKASYYKDLKERMGGR